MSTSSDLPASGVDWPDAARRAAFERWLAPLVALHRLDRTTLRAASADASFRRYLRIDAGDRGSLIVMDAPPPQEDVRPFVRVARLIEGAGLHAPQVLACDEAQGFVLLTDLGTRPYLAELQACVAQGDAAGEIDRGLGPLVGELQVAVGIPGGHTALRAWRGNGAHRSGDRRPGQAACGVPRGS